MNDKPDFFDRMFASRALRWLQPLYVRYKGPLLYMLFGVGTTLISIGVFDLFTRVIPLDALVANVIAWVLAVLFAFVTNRTWVFSGAAQGSFARQMLDFYLGRAATLGLEELILLVFVKKLQLQPLIVKVAGQVVIVVLNYVISKLFVFRKKS